MKKYLVLAVFASLFSPAHAGEDTFANCRFTQECLEGESCTATDFEVTIQYDDNLAFIMETVAENIDGIVFDNRTPDETTTLLGVGDTAYHLLSIAPGGEARYSVHMQGPMAITYTGHCKVAS